MSNRNTTSPCPNCKRIFSTQCSLKLHLPSCRRNSLSTTECHSKLEHHPLRSFHQTSNHDDVSQCDPSECDDDDSDMDDFSQQNHVSVWMIMTMPTTSLMNMSKVKDNKVRQHQSYKSSSTI